MTKKVVLAYSGGLDTSVMVKWLKETYNCEVIACIVDVGQKENFSALRTRALNSGAAKVYVFDAKEEFVVDYIYPVVKSNALYEQRYLLGSALSRPLIAKKVVEVAKKESAFAVSHGATGKGNDQVRFEVSFRALAPRLKIIAPWREWELKSREDEIEFAKKHNIPVTVTETKPYSTDANLWHISYEGGILEDITKTPPENIFQLTNSPQDAPDKPQCIEIYFEKGEPKKLNGRALAPVELIHKLNKIAGEHSIGRVDLVENRLVGMKSRGVYECPAGTLLYLAHRELESITLDRDTMHYKELLSQKYAELIYYGLWFSELKESIDKFIDETQKFVTGTLKLKLYKGTISTISRKSPYSLYWKELATFGRETQVVYNQKLAEGFIKLFGLPIEVQSILRKKGRRI
ncbi:MAG: argininosuccinate synthase [Elusimicrobiota bacterium]|nr:argininosuccinate synthase [Elusimicrobiota bacterium]